MTTKLRFLAALLTMGALLGAAGSAGAAMIGIYRNPMSSVANRSAMVKLTGRECQRGGFAEALRVVVGKRTKECSYRTPVVGRDLEIAATERLLSGTPTVAQKKAYLGLVLRSGGGARYEMRAFPLQRKVQLLRVLKGETSYLAIDHNETALAGLNEANALRLSAVNVTSGPERGHCHLLAYVGATLVAEASDEAAGELRGRASGIAVGATARANGVAATVGELLIRVPSPF